ncbi:hypothetical protein BpHYR1_054128 [Brachionus plicatilis]|uniref:Uncharacterized protein n=1 Tax=Brachionus plicatilis TaxID=10195 RepID=A0A3M7SMC1_BRAPC|nr:hypothetical protein BpHYR1_054128 [Brachionus plicatilis]
MRPYKVHEIQNFKYKILYKLIQNSEQIYEFDIFRYIKARLCLPTRERSDLTDRFMIQAENSNKKKNPTQRLRKRTAAET